MFEILTEENTATVTCTNPLTGCNKTVLTGNNDNAIAYAVLCFATRQGITPDIVQTSIIYPIEEA
jgi:hypothetical protein